MRVDAALPVLLGYSLLIIAGAFFFQYAVGLVACELCLAERWPWYGAIMRSAYSAQEFLSVGQYKNVNRWVELIAGRRAVKRGQIVNRTLGPPEGQLAERHDASDIDKIVGA